MKNTFKISIITATYNNIQFLPGLLGSIHDQTYSSIEHIIIDGGSSDGTVETLKQCNLISHFISEPDYGIYDALNKGLRIATGDIIGFLHSDDLFALPQTIENIVQAFATPLAGKGSTPDVVYGDLVFVDQHDSDKIIRFWKSQTFNRRLLHQGWMPPHPTVFMLRGVYEKHGFFDINLKCSADYDYILRVFQDKALTVSYLPQVITKMRVGGMSTSGFSNIINKKKEDYWVLKKNKMKFPLWILLAKNFTKIPQYFFKEKNS